MDLESHLKLGWIKFLETFAGRSDKKIATDFFIVRVNDTAPKKAGPNHLPTPFADGFKVRALYNASHVEKMFFSAIIKGLSSTPNEIS